MTRSLRLFKGSLLLGNVLEHYDTALFSLLSPFIAPLFFPSQDTLTALILTYCLIPLGMLARPFGSLLFGYIGDTKGRKAALVCSLLGIAIITTAMGFMPTYAQVGIFAPILLCLGRILQNLFAAGEIAGGAIYLLENTADEKHDMMSSYYNASTIVGILCASFGVSLLALFGHIEDYWRLLYFLGCLTALFAGLLRSKVSDLLIQTVTIPRIKLKVFINDCWSHWRVLVTLIFASGFSYASYTLALVTINGFMPFVSPLTPTQMMHLNTFFLLIDLILLPLFGLLSTRYSGKQMMVLASGSALLSGLPLFWLINQKLGWTLLVGRFCLVIIGVWFSTPFYAWSQKLVAPAYRYTILSLGYALGSQLLGGPSAAISLWLFQKTAIFSSVAWYWMGLGIVTSFLIAKQENFGSLPQKIAFRPFLSLKMKKLLVKN